MEANCTGATVLLLLFRQHRLSVFPDPESLPYTKHVPCAKYGNQNSYVSIHPPFPIPEFNQVTNN